MAGCFAVVLVAVVVVLVVLVGVVLGVGAFVCFFVVLGVDERGIEVVIVVAGFVVEQGYEGFSSGAWAGSGVEAFFGVAVDDGHDYALGIGYAAVVDALIKVGVEGHVGEDGDAGGLCDGGEFFGVCEGFSEGDALLPRLDVVVDDGFKSDLAGEAEEDVFGGPEEVDHRIALSTRRAPLRRSTRLRRSWLSSALMARSKAKREA